MRRSLRRFGSDRRGNFAIATALAALPLTLAIGMGVDVATIAKTHSSLQQALDAAALGVSREGTQLPDAAALRIATEFVNSNFSGSFSNLRVTRVGTSVRVEADALADTSFGGLFGYNKWPITEVATSDIAYIPYEIALVLDTTGSMNENGGGKLRSLKDAVTQMIDTMSKDVPDKKYLKFAMVPFAAFVNVGPQYGPQFDKKGRVVKGSGASWLDTLGKSGTAQTELMEGVSRFEAFHNLGQDWAGCVESRQPAGKNAFDTADLTPNGSAESLFVPAFGIDEPDGPPDSGPNSYIASEVDPLGGSDENILQKLAKYGLYSDSGAGLTRVASFSWHPVTTAITPDVGPNANCQVRPIVPLSNDYAGMKEQVEALAASGNTNITEGVAWGWRVLSAREPFAQGSSNKAKTKKIAIVLTDGSNTFGKKDKTASVLESTYGAYGFAADQRLVGVSASEDEARSAMNDKTLATCENAKADGVEIYTIRLEEPDKTTGMLLKDCASDAEHFFDAPSHSQLEEVFDKIRTKIISIRISS